MDNEIRQRIHSFISQISDSLLAGNDDNPYYYIQEWIVNICANYYHANTHVIDSKILSNDQIYLFCELIHKRTKTKDPNFFKLIGRYSTNLNDTPGWYPQRIERKHKARLTIIKAEKNIVFGAYVSLIENEEFAFCMDQSKEKEEAKVFIDGIGTDAFIMKSLDKFYVNYDKRHHQIVHHEIFSVPKCTPLSKPFFESRITNLHNYCYLETKAIKKNVKEQWQRRFIVLKHNFLWVAARHYSEKFVCVMPLHKKTNVQKLSDCSFKIENTKPHKYKLHLCASTPAQCTKCYAARTLKIKDVYRFRSKLGTKVGAQVIGAIHRITNEECVIRIIDKRLCDKNTLRSWIQIQQKINCPNVVKILDLIETRKYAYIVTEMLHGGKFFDQNRLLNDESAYTEDLIVSVLHQIAKAVKYFHECGIVLINLEPKHILCVDQNNIEKIKITNLGFGALHGKKSKENMTAIKSLFSAPEIFNKGQGYDHRADYYSIGAIMKMMICGNSSNKEFEKDWKHVSVKMKWLCEGLMHNDPAQRMTCDNILMVSCNKSSYFPAIQCMNSQTRVMTSDGLRMFRIRRHAQR